MTVQPIDIIVLVVHLAVMLSFGLYFYFKVDQFTEYYDGGRRWGVWLIGFAVASANLGAANTVGSVTLAYREGVSAAWYVALQALAFIPFAFLAVPKFYPRKETTLAEYLENRYHPWLRPYFGLVSVMTVAASRMKFKRPATLAVLFQSVGLL